METIRGTVQRVYFNAPEGTFCAFTIVDQNEERTAVTARCRAPHEGDELELQGKFVVHPKYGEQFDAAMLQQLRPDTLGGAVRFLENLRIRGLGEKSIQKMAAYFGEELVSILHQDKPEQLLEIPGIRSSVKQDLYDSLAGAGVLSDIHDFLENNGISSKWSRELYELYGARAIEVIRNNPYSLIRTCRGFTFATADTLAFHLGFGPEDDRRLEAALQSECEGISESGNTCLPFDELIRRTYDRVGGFADELAARIEELLSDGILYGCEYDGVFYIYPPALYMAEAEGVRLTEELMSEEEAAAADMSSFFEEFEERQELILGEEQRQAINNSLTHKVSLITGGPGTGKTTIIKALVEAFQLRGLSRIVLCAPTGRAAKRLTEAAAYEATTIHRLLMPVAGSDAYDFMKNEDDPLEADVVIVDEASMLNVQLYYALLAAIPASARLIVVGDVDQLPPIGPGFVLRDLLDCEMIPAVRLHLIYRQMEGNSIVANAHLINEGKMPSLAGDKEFRFISVASVQEMLNQITALYKEEESQAEDVLDVQIISPMRRGNAGSLAISRMIQEYCNPFSADRGEVKSNGILYRTGDKVIQTLNNYELEVFNGEIGIIFAISKTHIFIRFTDKEIQLPLEDAGMIMPAYAITVHKSQGSEYGTVIIPFIPVYSVMLQRNLLYTAVTRARNKVILVGTEKAIRRAVDTVDGRERYTLFKDRLQHLVED